MSTEIIQHQVVKSWATITQLPAFAALSRFGWIFFFFTYQQELHE